MAVCPKCNKEIEYLNYTASTHTTGYLQLQNDELEYSDDEVYFNEADFILECPECDEELFTHSNDAEDFLRADMVKEK